MTSSIVMGQPVSTVWRTVAADIGGVSQPDQIGRLHMIVEIRFAFRWDAEQWAEMYGKNGYEASVASAACSYHGPTDAPGNCWSVRAERIVKFYDLTGKTGVYGEDWVYA
jgi:hypothetical protein